MRIKSFTEVPEDVAGYGPSRTKPAAGDSICGFAASAKGVLIAHIPGVEDRDQAEALRGLRLYLPARLCRSPRRRNITTPI